ncbi:MAG: sigma-54 dependent transcriptional regulator, partial [Myxococcota bacterium]
MSAAGAISHNREGATNAIDPAERHCVFLVDDDEHLRPLIRRWLELRGHEVVEFATGEACLEGLAEREPNVVLLDLHMPGAGGVSTLQQIKARHRFLPVVVLTVDRDVKTVVQTMQIGAYDFLVKPLDPDKLNATVSNAIESYRVSVRIAELEREDEGGKSGLIGESESMRELNRQISRLGGTEVSVYIHGESGTGKELIARAIHQHSDRNEGPFVAINCAAIPDSLQESELFGHEKGSFTGAANKRIGKFELANHGTLFLDEVADLSASAQSKLLRVLQERRVLRVGGSQEIPLDFRVLAATHRDLREEVRLGRFREDLYFRIVVFELKVPPLRERDGD